MTKSKSNPVKDIMVSLDETILDIINDDSLKDQEKVTSSRKTPKINKSDFNNIRKENASTPKTPRSKKCDDNQLVLKGSKANQKIGKARKVTAHCSSPVLSKTAKAKPVFKNLRVNVERASVLQPFKAPSVPLTKRTVSPIKLSRKASGSIWEQDQPDARPSPPSAPYCTVRSCDCFRKCTPSTCSCRLDFCNIVRSTESLIFFRLGDIVCGQECGCTSTCSNAPILPGSLVEVS